MVDVLERRLPADQHRRNLPVEDVRLNADHHDVPVAQARLHAIAPAAQREITPHRRVHLHVALQILLGQNRLAARDVPQQRHPLPPRTLHPRQAEHVRLPRQRRQRRIQRRRQRRNRRDLRHARAAFIPADHLLGGAQQPRQFLLRKPALHAQALERAAKGHGYHRLSWVEYSIKVTVCTSVWRNFVTGWLTSAGRMWYAPLVTKRATTEKRRIR